MNKKQIMGFLGSIFLFIGVFAPLFRIPMLDDVNCIQGGSIVGIIIIFLAVISFVLTITKKYKGLWITGIGSLGVIVHIFINFQIKMVKALAKVEVELIENPFKDLILARVKRIELHYGWALLIIGAILLITTTVIKGEK